MTRRKTGVEAAVRRDLDSLPGLVQESAEAAAALELARAMDDGWQLATCSRELRAVMAQLRERAVTIAAQQTGSRPTSVRRESREAGDVVDLATSLSARRAAAAGGAPS